MTVMLYSHEKEGKCALVHKSTLLMFCQKAEVLALECCGTYEHQHFIAAVEHGEEAMIWDCFAATGCRHLLVIEMNKVFDSKMWGLTTKAWLYLGQ